jgi:NADPH-dependent F420 reductase
MPDQKTIIAVLGGAGAEGSGLAVRWAHAGYRVVIGSRTRERARACAATLNEITAGSRISGEDNETAARAGDVVVLTVPHAAQLSTLESVRQALDGKILIDVTVPLVPPSVSRVQLPEGDSAVVAAQRLLGPAVKVVSAFQNVSAHHLKELDHVIECDVLCCGDDREAVDQVIALAQALGLRAFYAGPLANSAATEALTSVLIAINRRYKIPASGIRITGVKPG